MADEVRVGKFFSDRKLKRCEYVIGHAGVWQILGLRTRTNVNERNYPGRVVLDS